LSDSQNKNRLIDRLWKVVSKSGRKRKSAGADQSEHERLITTYETFCEILALNDSTLQLIADIEDRIAGQTPFSFNSISRRIRRACMDVFVMAKNLDTLAMGRYRELYDSIKKINAAIEAELVHSAETIIRPLVVNLKDVRKGDAGLVGTKMANLGEVKNVLRLQVPDGFVITVGAYNRFIRQNELLEKTDTLEAVYESFGPRVAAEACREVQQKIIDTPVPEDIQRAIDAAYDEVCGGDETLMAVRSSAAGEDTGVSHAGIYLTELNINRALLPESYRWVVASAFSIRSVAYRFKYGYTSDQARMAVGCLKMIEPKFSGILFTRPIDNFQADKIAVSVTSGLADHLARGKMNAEEITIAPSEIKAGISALGKNLLEDLYMAARLIEKHFGQPQDIEWAIDEHDTLFILQTRALASRTPDSGAAEMPPEIDAPILLEGGHTACPGTAGGEVCLVRGDDDLETFPAGGILVAPHSAPGFSMAMNRAAAIITDRGSPIGHMAILAREFGVPTIVGLEGASVKLTPGTSITVDAGNRRIYQGIISGLLSRKEKSAPLADSIAVQRLKKVARHIAPLNLVDTASPTFSADKCETIHDIARFVHEKVFEVMFRIGERAASVTAPYKISANLPYDVLVLDLGGGINKETNSNKDIELKDILSDPLKAFIKGLTDSRINRSQPRAISARGFMSVLGESITSPPPDQQGLGKTSFAIVTDRYMNFSTKAGYHFSTVDTYCGNSLNKNYIHFRFEGGAAAETRRARRCKFLMKVLATLDFNVQCRQDILFARLEKYEREYLIDRLEQLGRLTICSRQLDMLMDNDDSPDFFARAFLDGELERF